MQILYSRCCGIDVHKGSVTVCVLIYSGRPEPEIRKKEFATHFKALGELRFWLSSQKVTHVAMESTGVYWKPVRQALEGHFELILANPYQVKNIPGKKTDARDSQWLAELLAHGLIRPSFVPPRETCEQRDLTRYRVKLTEERNRIHNRIHKVLEDACIKLDTVASDILGATGRAIIQAIIDGVESPNFLAERAKGRLLAKIPQLRLVLRGRVTDHHRLMLHEWMEDLEFVERKILRLEQNIASRADLQTVARLCGIPGVDMVTAWTILAELGTDMRVFAGPKHAASWAGLCPGNHESTGKRLSNRTRKGNRWLRRAFCQAARAATRKKNCYLAAFFYPSTRCTLRFSVPPPRPALPVRPTPNPLHSQWVEKFEFSKDRMRALQHPGVSGKAERSAGRQERVAEVSANIAGGRRGGGGSQWRVVLVCGRIGRSRSGTGEETDAGTEQDRQAGCARAGDVIASGYLAGGLDSAGRTPGSARTDAHQTRHASPSVTVEEPDPCFQGPGRAWIFPTP